MSNSVDHPSHYNAGKIEIIDVIEDQKLDFHLGNVIKYVTRAGKKDASTELEDLKKALWYLERKIALIEVNAPAHHWKFQKITLKDEIKEHLESDH